MPIDASFATLSYRTGTLCQQCDSCSGWQQGHGREIVDCPRCGEPLGAKRALVFGGLAARFDGRRVRLSTPCTAGELTICMLDLPDLIQFLCSLTDDWRGTSSSPRFRMRSGMGTMPEARHWKRDYVPQGHGQSGHAAES